MRNERKDRLLDLVIWLTWAALFAMIAGFWITAAMLTLDAVIREDVNPWDRAAAAAEESK